MMYLLIGDLAVATVKISIDSVIKARSRLNAAVAFFNFSMGALNLITHLFQFLLRKIHNCHSVCEI